MTRTVEIKNTKHSYVNLLEEYKGSKDPYDTPLNWLALCLLNQSGEAGKIKKSDPHDQYNIQEINVGSQGIHLKINDTDIFIRAKSVESEEKMLYPE